ncbi:Hepatocyte growth factor-regulated tyrosine kinase substrate [Gryllus bimaculatus]|nr:Hepatocyte growth factor-regulated tyrosine kinase substrate [Gryllus bimaculatus]
MFRSTSNFDKLLEKATSNLRLEPDWPTIMQICDLIRQGDVQPKYALGAVKKKLYNANPHSAMFGLLVLESCVKNCGHLIHDEVGTKQYMEQLRELVKTTSHDNVKAKVLELIQAWAYAFRNSPKYRAVQDTLNIMKTEGYKFPTLKESDAMFSADTAPEWADGDVCHRCRVQFGMVQRKHHCRACGQVFCGQCSSKTSTLPKFGIEKEVRVCEACYDNINKPTTTTATSQKPENSDLPPEYVSSVLSQQSQAPPPRRTEEELREEEELQLALALSKSEAEHKEKEKKRTTSALMSNAAAVRAKQYSPPLPTRSSPEPTEEDMDPELARYLNRSYWEKRQSEDRSKSGASSPGPANERDRRSPTGQQPSAPSTASSPPVQITASSAAPTSKLMHQKQENGETDSQIEEFVGGLKSQLEIFVNRMKSNSSRGRSIANDSSVQTLFMNITAMHSRLLRYIQQQDDGRVYFEGLQDKMAQVKDARAALDALREEHREKLRRQAEEAERLRQLQMAHKLEIMRKKKQEYLQYQRQLALQRIQEQEREMQMRQEQQKQQYLMGSMGPMPPGPMGYPMPPYMTPGIPQNYPPVGVDAQHPQFPIMSQGPPSNTFNSLPPGGGSAPMPYAQFSPGTAMAGMPQQPGPASANMAMGPGPMLPPHMLGPRNSLPLAMGVPSQGPSPGGPPQPPPAQPLAGPSPQGPAPGPPQGLPQGPAQGTPQGPPMAFPPQVAMAQGGAPPAQGPQGPTPSSPQQTSSNEGLQTEELIRFD